MIDNLIHVIDVIVLVGLFHVLLFINNGFFNLISYSCFFKLLIKTYLSIFLLRYIDWLFHVRNLDLYRLFIIDLFLVVSLLIVDH